MRKENHRNMRNILMKFLLVFVVIIVLRVFFIEIYTVSQYSMNDTLQEGDRLLVSKLRKNSFARNDIIIFKLSGSYFVKRIVGLPGEMVYIQKGKLFVNGKEIPFSQTGKRREATDMQKIPEAVRKEDNFNIMTFETYGEYWSHNFFGPFKVPNAGMNLQNRNTIPLSYKKLLLKENTHLNKFNPGEFKWNYYFVIGDNWDYSQDSREFGVIAANKIIGTVPLILFSGKNLWSARFMKKVN